MLINKTSLIYLLAVKKKNLRLNEKPNLLETLKHHLLLLILAGMLGVFLPIMLSVLFGIVCVISGNETSCQISNSSETGWYLVETVAKIWHLILEGIKPSQ